MQKANVFAFFFLQAARFRLQRASTLTNLALLEVSWALYKRMGGDRILPQRGDRLVQASSLLCMKGAHPEPPSVPPCPPTLAAPATLFVTRYWQRNQHQKMGFSQIVSVGLSPVALKLKSGWVAPFLSDFRKSDPLSPLWVGKEITLRRNLKWRLLKPTGQCSHPGTSGPAPGDLGEGGTQAVPCPF